MKIVKGRRSSEEFMNTPWLPSTEMRQGQAMNGNYAPLENYLRKLPMKQEEITLTFESIEQILNDRLPRSAHEDAPWWGNQKQGIRVDPNAWMDAGWMVEIVDLKEKWVRFVRQ